MRPERRAGLLSAGLRRAGTPRAARLCVVLVHGILLALAGVALLAGCLSPEQRAATERAWAERDRERALECAQRGGRYISSSCLQGGGP